MNLFTSMTTDQQLYKIANKVGLRLEPIIYKNELLQVPKLTEKRNYNYIINMSNSNEIGSHWIGLFVDAKRRIAYYFNSFAEEFNLMPIEIITFTMRNKLQLYYSQEPIQNPYRGFCGQYVIAWLLEMNKTTDDLLDYNRYMRRFNNSMELIYKFKSNKLKKVNSNDEY